MIKILHISSAISWRGGEQQLAYMLDGLIELNVANYLIAPINSEFVKKYKNKEVNLALIKKSHGLSLKWAKKIKQICKIKKIDIIHCHDSKAHTYTVLSSIFFNNKTPMIVHRKVVFKIKNSFFTKYKYKKANHIICISKSVQKEVIKIIPKTKTSIVYSAVSCIKKKNIVNLRKHYEIPQKNKIIGYISALTYEKDHQTFIKVANNLLLNNKNLTFLIIGNGKLKDKIKNNIKKSKNEKNIILTGFIEDAKLLINQFDILLFTSLFEGLGTTVLDAFMQKTPVVTVKNGGCEELVKQYETGIICNKKDIKCLSEGCLDILNNNLLSEKIINNSFDYVNKNHSLQTMSKQLLKIYNRIKNE